MTQCQQLTTETNVKLKNNTQAISHTHICICKYILFIYVSICAYLGCLKFNTIQLKFLHILHEVEFSISWRSPSENRYS